MEKKINQILEKQNKSEVKEILFDRVRCTEISGLDSDFKNLEMISANNLGLKSLKNLPALPKLEKLELSDNRITGGLEPIAQCKSLRYITLAGNRIKELKELKPLKELEKLECLDLFGCPVTKVEGYRKTIFEWISSLQSLDGLTPDGKELSWGDIEDDEEEEEEEDEDDEEEANDGDDEFEAPDDENDNEQVDKDKDKDKEKSDYDQETEVGSKRTQENNSGTNGSEPPSKKRRVE